MSYPSQPSYTPPYGQPPAPRQTNLWLVGGAIIAVLVVIMGVTLFIFQQNKTSDEGGGADPTTSEAEPTEEEPTEEEPTDEEPTAEEPTDDGGGGDTTAFSEDTCSTFDLSPFEEVIGGSIDPTQTSTSAFSSGATGSVTCRFYTAEFWHLKIYVDVTDDAEFNIGWVETEQVNQAELEGYEVTDYTELGDAGYMSNSEDTSYQLILIDVAVANIELETEVSIDPSRHDEEEAIAMLEDFLTEAYLKFAGYEQ